MKTAEVLAFFRAFTFAEGKGQWEVLGNEKGVLTSMGSVYRWQVGVLEGRKRDEMVFNSLGYNQTDQELKNLTLLGGTDLSKYLIPLTFINH